MDMLASGLGKAVSRARPRPHPPHFTTCLKPRCPRVYEAAWKRDFCPRNKDTVSLSPLFFYVSHSPCPTCIFEYYKLLSFSLPPERKKCQFQNDILVRHYFLHRVQIYVFKILVCVALGKIDGKY